jgi:hypothetical protein
MTKKTTATKAKKAQVATKTSKTSTSKKTTNTTKKAAPTTKAKKTTPAPKVTKITKTRTEVSVENGMKILKTAIKNELSLSEASRRNSFGRNYLSDVKSKIKENYKNKKINRETYQNFSALLKTYNSL